MNDKSTLPKLKYRPVASSYSRCDNLSPSAPYTDIPGTTLADHEGDTLEVESPSGLGKREREVLDAQLWASSLYQEVSAARSHAPHGMSMIQLRGKRDINIALHAVRLAQDRMSGSIGSFTAAQARSLDRYREDWLDALPWLSATQTKN